ncbi:MAG: hypothetical protein ACK4TG_05680, partial [Thermaurantiacus sp.]
MPRRTLALYVERWPLARPFVIARGSFTHAAVLVAEIGEQGATGRGEAAGLSARRDTPEGLAAQAETVRAAIEAGVPYVSLCDDYDAAQAVLELDLLAKEKGVTVITGLGWTPGLSNVLARRAADQLDEVDEIHVAWAGSA